MVTPFFEYLFIGGAVEILEWFVQNIIGKGAELFLDIVRILWRVVGEINNFIEIGFWPSVVFVSTSYVIWNLINYYDLANSPLDKESVVYQQKKKNVWKQTVWLAVLAAFLLASICEGGIVAGKAYLLTSMLYIFVFLRFIFFVFELLGKHNAKHN